ncbi:unnamed protein product [Brassicogethes aeneus]|uniref:Uncharacterized protein n=1 Tax=Brassicogethes aeneus TaxID=1431903 RepID=A0A9P0BDL9_BRAAE|nr:unnamed protein product [Brassicogethes aeneus]
MYGRPLLYLLTLCAIALATEERKVHRLVGGHLRIINPDSDDSELMTAASGSREKTTKADDEDKKTLAQQVADGKYGLIHKELFTKPPKRPGVISYADNPEVPLDNINTLGGLTKNDIWLAENHLLVIKGGTYPQHDDKNDFSAPIWPAIDDYKAPTRQVKIPAHPKVPPPFPVQLHEGGPLQILGTNSSRTLNGTETGYALPPPEGYEPGEGPYFPSPFPPPYPDPTNLTAGQAPFPIPGLPAPGEYPAGGPFPPLNGTLPPFFGTLPPGAAIIPALPPVNQSDYDEDDPSIYYPPPYSFYYPKDNTSLVPAGPLVPGIILPPPPNFFAPLEETTKAPYLTRKPARTRKPTTTKPPTLYPTTTPHSSTPITHKKTTKKPTKVYPVHVTEINNELKPIVTTRPPKLVTIIPARQSNRTYAAGKPQKKQKVTILRPVSPTTQKIYAYNNEAAKKPFNVQYVPPTKSSIVSTTQVPLKIYYSTANEIESNSVTQQPPPEKFSIRLQQVNPQRVVTTKKPAQYYFYEEEPQQNSVTTQKPYFNIPKEYYVQAKPSPPVQPQQSPQYIYVTGRPYNTQKPKFRYVQQPQRDSFSIHIAKLHKQIHQYYTTPRPSYRPIHQPRPVYQYSFEANGYQKPKVFRPSVQDDRTEDKFRPLPKYSVQIQQAIEVIPTEASQQYQNSPSPVYYRQNYPSTTAQPAKPDYDYEEAVTQKQYLQPAVTPRPVAQYHYEVTPSPAYQQGYYTKPEEGNFDDITKKYFTMFGKKLPSGTTPLTRVEATTGRPIYRQEQQQNYRGQQRPISLESDTYVNYVNPRPSVNPQAELISNVRNYPQVAKYVPRPAQQQNYRQQPRQPSKQHLRDEPEIVKAIPVEVPAEEDQGGSFISYQLPGDDGAHFYFLTPQLAQRRDQGAGYYYNTNPENARIRRENDKTR